MVLAFLGAVAARDSGRHALWGLLVAAFPAFVFTVARDLSEVLAASALLAGLLLYRRQRPLAAAAALALAVLTRESALVAVVALFLAWLVGERRLRDAVAWALPAGAFALWEGVVYADVGSLPVRGDSGNLTAPLAGLLPELAGWLGDPASKAVVLRLAVLALLVWVLVLAGASLRRSSARPQEKLAWALFLALAVCLSREIYLDPADFRVLGELWVLTVLVLLADARRAASGAGGRDRRAVGGGGALPRLRRVEGRPAELHLAARVDRRTQRQLEPVPPGRERCPQEHLLELPALDPPGVGLHGLGAGADDGGRVRAVDRAPEPEGRLLAGRDPPAWPFDALHARPQREPGAAGEHAPPSLGDRARARRSA